MIFKDQFRLCWLAMVSATLLVVLSACRSSSPMLEDNFYRLTSAPVIERYPAPVLQRTLYVELPRAAGVRRSRAILYSTDPDHLQMRQYHHHHWEEEPAKLLQRRLVAALRGSGLAPAVSTDSRQPSDYILRTELRRFDRTLSANGAAVLVEIDTRLGAGRGSWLFQASYQQNVTAESKLMNDTVVAFSRALDNIILELARDLQGVADAEGVAAQ